MAKHIFRRTMKLIDASENKGKSIFNNHNCSYHQTNMKFTLLMTSGSVASTLSSAPSDSQYFNLLPPTSTAITLRPIALAYWMARWPRPPPAPIIVTKSPGVASVSFKALYDVTPAHSPAVKVRKEIN